jgi:H+/gluconate symporter-like permease
MGFPVLGAIVIVSLAVGIAVQILEKKIGWDWLIIAVPAAFGAYFASETFPDSTTFGAIKDFGPTVDGLYLIPGIVTGALLALVTYLGTRNLQTTASPASSTGRGGPR